MSRRPAAVLDAPARPSGPSARQAPRPPSRRPPSTATLTYLPGLDGLRAISVIAVLLYHAGLAWIPGGFLGVEVFFVISGYLITLLLLTEHERSDQIDLRQFWLRRARRLLPALYLLLTAVAIWTVLFFRDELGELRGQALSALTYVTNWYLIATETSYFDQLGRPPVLRHLWSLAVEEQFYLLWPLIVLGLVTVFRRRVVPMAAVIVGGAAVSTVWMAVLYTPDQDPSRVYYGTDTRAAGLLLGAALALFWRPAALRRGPIREQGPLVDLFGVLALLVIVLFFLRAGETSAFLYLGGFAVLSLVTLVAIAAVTHPGTVLGGRFVLGSAPLRWVGTRSYGLYLWHWPIYVHTRPGVDVDWSPTTALAVRLALTAALTEVSYRLVEQPIRAGALGRWFRSLRGAPSPLVYQRRRVTAAAALVSLAVLVPVVGLIATATPRDEIAASLEAGREALGAGSAGRPGGGPTTVAAPATTNPVTAPPTTAAPAAPTSVSEVTAPAAGGPAPTTPAPSGAPAKTVTAIGDSVMLGAVPALQQVFGDRVVVDANESRQLKGGAETVERLAAAGQLGEVVVVHLGTNAVISTEAFDRLMAAVGGRPVLFLTVKVPMAHEAKVNGFLAENVARYPNARLADWKGFADPNRDWFYKDGIHLKPTGAAQYAQFIAQNLP